MREVFGVSSFGIHEWESTASYNLVGASNLVDVLFSLSVLFELYDMCFFRHHHHTSAGCFGICCIALDSF
jgi:hypothetical protein